MPAIYFRSNKFSKVIVGSPTTQNVNGFRSPELSLESAKQGVGLAFNQEISSQGECTQGKDNISDNFRTTVVDDTPDNFHFEIPTLPNQPQFHIWRSGSSSSSAFRPWKEKRGDLDKNRQGVAKTRTAGKKVGRRYSPPRGPSIK